jgi:hypothetical protein
LAIGYVVASYVHEVARTIFSNIGQVAGKLSDSGRRVIQDVRDVIDAIDAYALEKNGMCLSGFNDTLCPDRIEQLMTKSKNSSTPLEFGGLLSMPKLSTPEMLLSPNLARQKKM